MIDKTHVYLFNTDVPNCEKIQTRLVFRGTHVELAKQSVMDGQTDNGQSDTMWHFADATKKWIKSEKHKGAIVTIT